MFAPLFIYSYLTAPVTKPARNERGASFTEYVVLLAGIVAVVAAGIVILQGLIEDKLASVTPL